MANSTVDSPGMEKKFPVLTKSQEKLDSLIQEMLFIREREPQLNIQSHSARTKIIKRTPPHSLKHLSETLALGTFPCHENSTLQVVI